MNVRITNRGWLGTSPELEANLARFAAFVGSPAARRAQVGDIREDGRDRWHFGRGDRPPINAVLTIAIGDPWGPRAEPGKQRTLPAKWGETLPGVRRSHGHVGFNHSKSRLGVPDFGFPDSQKATEVAGKSETDLIATGEFGLGCRRQSNTEGGPDDPPRPAPDWMRDGSFQGFRRLRAAYAFARSLSTPRQLAAGHLPASPAPLPYSVRLGRGRWADTPHVVRG